VLYYDKKFSLDILLGNPKNARDIKQHLRIYSCIIDIIIKHLNKF